MPDGQVQVELLVGDAVLVVDRVLGVDGDLLGLDPHEDLGPDHRLATTRSRRGARCRTRCRGPGGPSGHGPAGTPSRGPCVMNQNGCPSQRPTRSPSLSVPYIEPRASSRAATRAIVRGGRGWARARRVTSGPRGGRGTRTGEQTLPGVLRYPDEHRVLRPELGRLRQQARPRPAASPAAPRSTCHGAQPRTASSAARSASSAASRARASGPASARSASTRASWSGARSSSASGASGPCRPLPDPTTTRPVGPSPTSARPRAASASGALPPGHLDDPQAAVPPRPREQVQPDRARDGRERPARRPGSVHGSAGHQSRSSGTPAAAERRADRPGELARDRTGRDDDDRRDVGVDDLGRPPRRPPCAARRARPRRRRRPGRGARCPGPGRRRRACPEP